MSVGLKDAVTEHGLRGSSAELTVDSTGGEQCVADFRRWFGP